MLPPSPSPHLRDDTRGYYSRLDIECDDSSHTTPRTPWRTLSAYPAGVCKATAVRYGRRRGSTLLCLCTFALLLSGFAFHQTLVGQKTWSIRFWNAQTVAFGKDELRKIWEWEIRSGHYPSTRPIPAEIGFTYPPENPATPFSLNAGRPAERDGGVVQYAVGTGSQRIYPDVRIRPPNFGHPPRPIPGTVADLDRIFERCDYDQRRYTRDCHEFLRIGAGLDNDVRLRREDLRDLRYVCVNDGGETTTTRDDFHPQPINSTIKLHTTDDWERDLILPSYSSRQHSACSKDDPRIFHMFWAGPFTDKPYMAMLAFLYTQNLFLHLDAPPSNASCRPQLWLWVSLGPADAMPRPTAVDDMYAELRANPWAAPFLHRRFQDVIRFRLWNTTEQLDGVPELKDDWRRLGKDFLKSDGGTPNPADADKKVGSDVAIDGQSAETWGSYNKLPVILSDLVRFVLCHRFGGVYLDVDMLFLRDWEELWGWKGAFAYRWSELDKYNTAVLRLRRGSALGTFLLRTGLVNGLDFHPHTVTKYLRAANMDGLLYRVPDALFDPAWLNTGRRQFLSKTDYQHDRPAQPFFTDFDQFFNTPPEMSGQPSVVGFDGFFRGAYLYHYHNEWWKPFDRARFWPDLGPRFADAERMGRLAVENRTAVYEVGLVQGDERDLDWATVLKRTFEAYIRGERPNMYGEWIQW